MNGLILILLVFTNLMFVFSQEKYTTKYDNISLKDILNNKRLLRNYANCLLDKGPCSGDGAELKKVLPDVIETGCSKCNEKQRNGSKVILRHLIDNEPQIWSQLEKKYDADGKYKLKYREEAKRDGINI